MQIPGAAHLRRPVPVDQLLGDIGERRIVDDCGSMEHPAQRQAGGGGSGHQPGCGLRIGDAAALNDDVGAIGPEPLDRLLRLRVRLRARTQDDPATAG